MGEAGSASGASDPGSLATAAVRALSPYVPGKPISELERELGIADAAKLASNENPYGPSTLAVAAMRAAVDAAWLYPDGGAHELKAALSRHAGVPAEWLTVGNGSNEVLQLLAEAFLAPDRRGVCSEFGFAVYPIVIGATGAECVVVPANPPGHAMPYGHDLAALHAALDARTRIVFIANPNNPTGTWLDAASLRRFVATAPPHTVVVLDEAYVEYARVDGLADAGDWVREFSRLVVVRTLSKAYGLAGVRVGYAISHPSVADVLNRIRPAFNVNNVAQAGAVAALDDQAHVARCAHATVAERARLAAGLRDLGLTVIPSAGNFLMVGFGDRAARVHAGLLRAGVIVRPLGNYGLHRHLRISVGLPAQTDRLLAALPALLREATP
jgi:histidinol-phosphate aminotransferase